MYEKDLTIWLFIVKVILNNEVTYIFVLLCLFLCGVIGKFDVKQYTYDLKHVYSDLNDIRLEYLETI